MRLQGILEEFVQVCWGLHPDTQVCKCGQACLTIKPRHETKEAARWGPVQTPKWISLLFEEVCLGAWEETGQRWEGGRLQENRGEDNGIQ